MHVIQRQILDLAQKHDLSSLGLREIGRMIGEPHPQKIKYHLGRLNLVGPESESKFESNRLPGALMSIPVYGFANCGEATIFADPQTEEHINISKSLISGHSPSTLFAVRAVGDSMNQANIEGKSIDSGDYVVVDSENKTFKSGDYVLSVINNLANIKRLFKDEENGQVVLMSESKKSYPPIFVSGREFQNYLANGKVVAVFKKPKIFEEDFRFEKVLNPS